MGLARRLQPLATVAEEIHGFRYRDSRDLTGFIDGTENPKGKNRAAAALIGEEDRPFAEAVTSRSSAMSMTLNDGVGWTTESRNRLSEGRSREA